MTKEIKFQIASVEHMDKQPFDARYALFCAPTMEGEWGLVCESAQTLAHLGDYENSTKAIEEGTLHPHPVIVKFFPLNHKQKPDWEINKSSS